MGSISNSLIGNVLWNGMLAVIPVALAYSIVWTARICRAKPVRYVAITLLACAWLAFLPNTCYLLTEWRHFLFQLDTRDLFLRARVDPVLMANMTAWSIFYLLYSGLGMMTFALAIRPLQHLAAKHGASKWFWAIPLFGALSIGVYLGLILRLNSWDIISRPGEVWGSIVEIGGRPRLIAFIIAFAAFLCVAYEALDVWVDGMADRWSRATGRKIHLGPGS